jgi:formamidopyrimidine-DNA glycosylase
MPEGPEVKIVVDGLNDVLKNKYIVDIKITPTSRYRNKAPDGFNDFRSLITQKKTKVNNIKCKGKFIYFEVVAADNTRQSTNNKWYIFNHLGMSGIWSHRPAKHTSIILTYSTSPPTRHYGNSNITNTKSTTLKRVFKLYFIDQRHFGLFEFTNKKSILNLKLNALGPDLLNDSISYSQFAKIIIKHSRNNICKVLMDQSIFSGIGNYLKSEILYDSKIHPLTNIGQLSSKDLKTLFNASRRLIKASYLAQGNSLRHYKNVESIKDTFEFQLKVYGLKKDINGNKVHRITTPDGRSTYYVDIFD